MYLKLKKSPIISIIIVIWATTTHATTFVLPQKGNTVGKNQHSYSKINETMDEVGRRFNVGYYEMVRANPHTDAVHTLPAHTPLLIPTQFTLPKVPWQGIIVNLAEYRLYYFPKNDNVVITFPVGIGKKGWDTPLGTTKVTAKVAHPEWRPTPSVRAAAKKIGAPLPSYFPPGPNNPLGMYVLRLGWPTFLIHGTNRLDGVGARVSAGCIRLLPSDIEELFELVPIGTSVTIINQRLHNFRQ